MSCLGPQETILGPFGGPWRPFWWSSWAQMHSGGPWRVPEWIFNDFWWILGPPLETILGHFLIFSVIWGVKKHVWIAGMVFDDFWLENQLIRDVSTSQKHSKYCGFHWISCFCRFSDFDDFRYLFGLHFWDIWRSWETILVIFRCSGNSLKFDWFPRPPRIENTDLVEGKLSVQGVLLQVLYHQFADL